MNTQQVSDQLLVQRMLVGKAEAFEDFFGTYFPGLYRFALARLNQDSDAAEEVVQRALCKAISKLASYRGEAALFTWLCTFCRHEISIYLKDQKRFFHPAEPIQEAPEILAALESLHITYEDRPDKALLRREATHLVQVVMDALPPRYADALEWKYIDGLAVKEIADRLNLGLKAAESLLTRARQAFRDAFKSLTSDLGWQPLLKDGGKKTL